MDRGAQRPAGMLRLLPVEAERPYDGTERRVGTSAYRRRLLVERLRWVERQLVAAGVPPRVVAKFRREGEQRLLATASHDRFAEPVAEIVDRPQPELATQVVLPPDVRVERRQPDSQLVSKLRHGQLSGALTVDDLHCRRHDGVAIEAQTSCLQARD